MTSPMDTTLPYGIRDIKLTRYLDQGGTILDTPDNAVDLPNGQTMKFSEKEDFDTLRGDDEDQATHGKGAGGSWELGAGGLSLEAVSIFTGAELTETGVTPNTVRRLRKKSTHQRPYFRVEGQSISDSGGDVHAVLFRCKMTEDMDGEFTDGQFYITGAKGNMLGSKVVGEEGLLYDFVQNETVTAIGATSGA